MNDRIQILPDVVKNKIAAGEVVEGPFSVLKELMENSLDAGAMSVDVEVEESGLKRILVRDDGHGIRRDDINLVTREHATSKMRGIEDIGAIATFGFRGEALSSIASIAGLTLLSRRRDEEIGSRLTSSGGAVETGDYAGGAGTTVIVERLFYNVPARKKFLKSRQAESRALKEAFLRVALAAPRAAFSLTVDGKRQLTVPSAQDRGTRIGQLFGEPVRAHLIEERLRDLKLEVHGFLSGPSFHRPSRVLQHLYVNNRHIEYRRLGFLLTRSYESLLRHGEHPAAFLFIDIEPSLVDVNVHPAKREVRFFDHGYIDGLIVSLARKALGTRPHGIDTGLFREGAPSGAATEKGGGAGFASGDGGYHGARMGGDEPANALFGGDAADLVREGRRLYESTVEAEGPSFLGTLFDAYILARDGEGLVIIDFHAAHERFIFDRLMEAEGASETQRLMFPLPVDLTPGECALVLDNLGVFGDSGFEVEQIAEGAVAVRGVPSSARGIDLEGFFRDLLSSLDGKAAPADLRRMIAEKAACHSAKRAGDALTRDDAAALLSEALSGRHELRCPHGRPYLFRLGREEIEKLFRRR